MTTLPTFGLSDSADFLDELRGSISDLQKDPVNPRLARYAAIVAWAMCDWVQKDLGEQVKHACIQKQCPALAYLHDLGNFFKHRQLNSPQKSTLRAAKRTGSFAREFSPEFDIVRLQLVLEDGTNLWFEDVIQEALEFWEKYFKDNGLTEGEYRES